jgi:hypothetical protein
MWRLVAVRCAGQDLIQRSTVTSGTLVLQASRDLGPDYWIFGITKC